MGDGEIVKREGAGKRGEVEEEEKERRGRVKFVLRCLQLARPLQPIHLFGSGLYLYFGIGSSAYPIM